MNIPLIFFIKNSNLFAEVYSEPCQTSKMENFQKQLQKTPFGCVTGHKEYKGKQKAFLKKMTYQKVTNLLNRGLISEDRSTVYSAFCNTTFGI